MSMDIVVGQVLSFIIGMAIVVLIYALIEEFMFDRKIYKLREQMRERKRLRKSKNK